MVNDSLDTQDISSNENESEPSNAITPETTIMSLESQVADLESKIAELKEKNLRLLAEMDNLKKRQAREISDFHKFAVERILLELLPVLDSMDKAVAAESIESTDQSMAAGFQMIQKQLVDSLSRQGLEAMNAKGKPFDPNLHQAIQRVESDSTNTEVVLEEYARGYLLHGRLLRAAMVSVAVPKAES